VDRRFWHFWHKGLTDLPYSCCRASDLYLAFKTWCRLNGERFVPNSTVFGETIGRELPRKRPRLRILSNKAMTSEDWVSGATETISWQGTVYIVASAQDGAPSREEVETQCKAFQGSVAQLLAAARWGM